jgi:hypothetical protein
VASSWLLVPLLPLLLLLRLLLWLSLSLGGIWMMMIRPASATGYLHVCTQSWANENAPGCRRMTSKFGKASSEWHYTDMQDEDVGPCSLAQMRTAWVEGALNAQSFVWHPVLVSLRETDGGGDAHSHHNQST